MSLEDLKQELRDVYANYYVVSFKNNDISLINEIVEYPLIYIKNGSTKSVDEYPVNPAELGWEFDVVAVNSQNAHVTASATRCRKDGSIIEYVHGFYGFKKVDNCWKMHVLTDLVY